MIRIWTALFIVICLLLPGCTQGTGNDLTDEMFDTDDMLQVRFAIEILSAGFLPGRDRTGLLWQSYGN